MSEGPKLFVFARKEVYLIFLMIVVVAAASFFFGVRVGKSYSYRDSDLKVEDQKRIEFLSGQEEAVQQVVQEKAVEGPTAKEKIVETSQAKLKEEFGRLDGKSAIEPKTNTEVATDKAVSVEEVVDKKVLEGLRKKDELSGKFTIQLGSYRSIKDAESFADGFRVRGYNPIINEVNVAGSGVWYRVCLGVFDNVGESKEYINKEKSLFRGTDFVIIRFD